MQWLPVFVCVVNIHYTKTLLLEVSEGRLAQTRPSAVLQQQSVCKAHYSVTLIKLFFFISNRNHLKSDPQGSVKTDGLIPKSSPFHPFVLLEMTEHGSSLSAGGAEQVVNT